MSFRELEKDLKKLGNYEVGGAQVRRRACS